MLLTSDSNMQDTFEGNSNYNILRRVLVHFFVILWQLCLIDFFYKTFAEYEAGFESKGEKW